MKLCNKCGCEKAYSEFNKNAKKQDGLQIWCRDCTKTYNNKSYKDSPTRKSSILARNKRDKELCKGIIRFYKSSGCFVCSESCIACIDLHHIDDNKEANVAELINHGVGRVIKEIHKCIALCSNCHKKYHAGIISLDLTSCL